MPFLGPETALGCVLGRRLGISSVLGVGGQNRRDFWGEEIPGEILAGFYRAAVAGLRIRKGKNGSPSTGRLGRGFRGNGTEKVHVWYRNTP
jgi:hypothetical protein